jgi:hypothetical protein
MTALPIKVRTLESYLAGIGASSALIAGAFVAFVVLVGIVTFDAWPTGSSVFNRGSDGVTVDTSLTTTPPASEQANVPDLARLLGGGGGGAAATTAPARVGGGGQAPGGPAPGGGGSPGQSGPQGTNPGGGQQQPAQPNQNPQPVQPVGGASGAESSSRNVVQQTVFTLGDSVQGTTDNLSNTLGGQDTALGGLVGGVGNTLNNTLQGLVGNK